MKYRVIKKHRPIPAEPLLVPRGKKITFERKPTQWEGWIRCFSSGGVSGWVPEAWVKIEGNTCVLLRDYDATELRVDVEEIVISEFTESGWVWVRKDTGESGWIPLECLEEVAD